MHAPHEIPSPYIGSLPIYGKSAHTWEVFPYMARLPIHVKTSHIWEASTGTVGIRVYPDVGKCPKIGAYHDVEVYPDIGGYTPDIGLYPRYRGIPPIWGYRAGIWYFIPPYGALGLQGPNYLCCLLMYWAVFPYMGHPPIYRNSSTVQPTVKPCHLNSPWVNEYVGTMSWCVFWSLTTPLVLAAHTHAVTPFQQSSRCQVRDCCSG